MSNILPAQIKHAMSWKSELRSLEIIILEWLVNDNQFISIDIHFIEVLDDESTLLYIEVVVDSHSGA